MSISLKAIKGCGYVGSGVDTTTRVTQRPSVFGDEGGCPGFKFPPYGYGSSHHFTTAVIATYSADVLSAKIDEYRAKLGWSPRREFKFSRLNDKESEAFLRFARTLPFEARVLDTHKVPYISDQTNFYARMLCDALKHASDAFADGGIVLWDESIQATVWKQNVKTYIRQQLNTDSCRLIHDMGFGASVKHNMLQLSDMVASSFHRKCEDGDDTFASIIADKVKLCRR